MRGANLMTIAWIASVSLGLAILWNFGARPGDETTTQTRWPVDVVPLADREFELVVFLHPFCACSKATVQELNRIVASRSDRLTVRVFSFHPENPSPEWKKSPLLESVRDIPGVTIQMDAGGRLAAAFGARTSGHTMLFSRDGQSLYSGGITMSRGHEGTNHGRVAIESIIDGVSSIGIHSIPVFGCRI